MKVLGLIPARANSVRAPGKNTAKIGDRSLIEWAYLRAKESDICHEIVCSTNDRDAILVCHDIGCTVVERPEALAQPDTPMIKVVRHVAHLMEPDVIILLQPTSPFRSTDDIKDAYKLLGTGDAVVSVTEPPEDLVFELGFAYRMRPAPCMVVPNGAIYIITAEHLKRAGNWYNGITYAHQMPKERSIDIDTPLDLEMARLFYAAKAAA